METRYNAIYDLMGGITKLLEYNFKMCDLDGEKATKETERDLKDILEKFGFKVEFIESRD